MEKLKNNNLIEKYSEQEFEFIISLLPYLDLVEPIKNNPKKFRQYIKGFRPEHVRAYQLQKIYYTRIYKKKDENLAKYTDRLIDKYSLKIEGEILEKIDLPKIVREKIENNDMEYFEKMVFLLLDTPLKENIELYFKIIDYELTNDQKKYLNNDLEQKIQLQELKNQIKKDLTERHEKKTQEIKEEYNNTIDDKNFQIKSLEQEIKDTEKKFELELSNKDLIIDDLKENHKKIYNEFLLKIETYKSKLDNLTALSDNFKNENSQKENKIKVLSELIEIKHTEFSTIANEKWIKDNEKLVKERQHIERLLETFKINKDEILKDINLLYFKKTDLEDKISLIEDRAGDFINNIKGMLEVIGFKQNNTNEQSKLHKISSREIDAEIEDIDEKLYFIDDLSSNLEICGINNEYSFDLAQYIYATFANKMSLLLVGYNTRKIADAVSYLINGESAEIITLPLGYNDCNELILTVSNSNSRVILIENTVDNISESVYIPLIKQNTDKFLLFSMESSENINFFSKSILNYMMMIDLDTLLGYESDSEILSGVANQDIFDVDIDISSKSNNLRHIKGLDNVIKISNVAKLKIAEVMSIIDKLKSNNAMYDILLFSINMLCKYNDRIDGFKEFIEKQEFNPVTFRMLQSVLGDGFGDE